VKTLNSLLLFCLCVLLIPLALLLCKQRRKLLVLVLSLSDEKWKLEVTREWYDEKKTHLFLSFFSFLFFSSFVYSGPLKTYSYLCFLWFITIRCVFFILLCLSSVSFALCLSFLRLSLLTLGLTQG
jgi:hypothetical protein